jgi:hypothetical protein
LAKRTVCYPLRMQLGALPPNPRHLSLCANSMIAVRDGRAASVDWRAILLLLPADGLLLLRHVSCSLDTLLWRIGLCWQAPRAPQQSGGMGDAAMVGRRLAAAPCYWHKAKNARGLGAEPPRYFALPDPLLWKMVFVLLLVLLLVVLDRHIAQIDVQCFDHGSARQ